jgi:chromosome segregation ATPase
MQRVAEEKNVFARELEERMSDKLSVLEASNAAEVKILQETANALRMEKQVLEEQVKVLETDLEGMQRVAEEKVVFVRELEETMSDKLSLLETSKASEVSTLQETVYALRVEKQSLEERVKALEIDLNLSTTCSGTDKAMLKSHLAAAQDKLDRLSRENKELQDQIQVKMEEGEARYRDGLETWAQEKATLVHTLEDMKRIVEEKTVFVRKLEEAMSQDQDRLYKMIIENRQLQQDLDEQVSDNASFKTQMMQQAREHKEQLNGQIEAAEALQKRSNDEWTAKHVQWQAAMAALKAEVEEGRIKVHTLHHELKAKTEKTQEMTALVDALEVELVKVRERHEAAAEMQMNQLEEDKAMWYEQIDALQRASMDGKRGTSIDRYIYILMIVSCHVS